MKKMILIPLILFTAFLLYSESINPLYIPRDTGPFFLNSASGGFTVENGDGFWPQTLVIETDGTGENVMVTAHDLDSFSLKNNHLVIWVKADNVKDIREFWIYASDGNDFSNRIVYMISSDKTQLREGQWVRLSMPVSAGSIWGTPDLNSLKAFQFWLNDSGSAPAAVRLGPVYMEEANTESCISITFDDGWKSQYQTAAPIMEKYGLKGTAYIIPELIGTEGYMSVGELKGLREDSGWSIGSHSLERLDSRTADELRALFTEQGEWFSNNGLSAADFAYANGVFDDALVQAVSEYYRSGRTIISYPETLPPGNPYLLRVANIYPPVNFEKLQQRLNAMDQQGELLLLVFHKIVDESEYETEIPVSDFEEICRMVAESGFPVKTVEELSASFTGLPGRAIEDWSMKTQFQPAASAAGKTAPAAPPVTTWTLAGPAAGKPEAEFKTQIDFSLDWRMVWGPGTDGMEFYTQLDDLHLYLQSDLSDSSRLFAAAGIEDVNFADFSRGAIDGSVFYLNSLYLEQDLPLDLRLTAGYFSPDPKHKWLQVTRSAGIEPAFGQDITPHSLWLQAAWTGLPPFGITAAFVPDVFGQTDGDTGLQVLKYQEELGRPNIFGSIWYDTENLDAEIAAALNGDALKAAAGAGYYYNLQPATLAASLGVKYTRGQDFTTWPEWDHIDNAWRLSAGFSMAFPVSVIFINPGLAYQAAIYSDGSVRHQGGIDVGISYDIFELYSVLTLKDISAPEWGNNAGFEAAFRIDFEGVEYIFGYTMSGFNALSGLYNNNTANDGGLDGPFLRIKATYW